MPFTQFQVNNLAAGLVAMGLKKGDRVGIWGPNMREWVITQFATAKAGFILVSTCQVLDLYWRVHDQYWSNTGEYLQ